MVTLHWLHDIPGTNRYVFDLYHCESAYPIREEVIRTRKGPEQARALLPAVTSGYRWELQSIHGPITKRLPA
jgi:hypothetical protein